MWLNDRELKYCYAFVVHCPTFSVNKLQTSTWWWRTCSFRIPSLQRSPESSDKSVLNSKISLVTHLWQLRAKLRESNVSVHNNIEYVEIERLMRMRCDCGYSSLQPISGFEASLVRYRTRSCRDPETTEIHFWLPGCVRRRLQCVTSAGSGRRREHVTAAAASTTAGRLRYCGCCWCW